MTGTLLESCLLPDHMLDRRRRDHVAQAVGAQENGAVVLDGVLDDLHKTVVVLVAVGAADIPKDLVAPWMLHRRGFADLPGILPLPDRRILRAYADCPERLRS